MDKYKFTLGYGGYKCDAAGNQSGEFYFADEVDELLAQLSALRSPAPAAPSGCVVCGAVDTGLHTVDDKWYCSKHNPAPAATVTDDIGNKRALFPDGVRTFNQQLKRITDVPCVCHKCKWSGRVFDCEPDVDGDGGLGCPKCNTVVECEGDAPATVTGWRLLNDGEVTQAGDEFYNLAYQYWVDVGDWIGGKVEGGIIRRRLSQPALTDVWRDTYNELDELIGVLERAHVEAGWIQVAPQFVTKMRLALAAMREGSGPK